ncbi:peptidase [Amylibacter marinus]|uniref:Peptidase n=1 Tax=Amylibacter marinus TaxID=1475483 RepID=A0ABQ5VYK0_9RHOB|nr:ATP-binding cassette domain-containing protein [Amylibacter marinus]GLQ36161.1 peptidase [Amylibacter marinus]
MSGEESFQNKHWRAFWTHSWLLFWAFGFSFVVAILSLATPFFMLLVYDRVLNARSIETLMALTLIASLLIVAMGFIDYARRRLLVRFAVAIQRDLEADLLLLPPYSTNSNEQNSLGLGRLDALRAFVQSGGLLNLVDVVWIPIFVGIVFIISPIIGLLSLLGLACLGAVFFSGRFLTSNLRHSAEQISKQATGAMRTLEKSGVWLSGQYGGDSKAKWLLDKRRLSRNASVNSNDIAVGFNVALSTIRWLFAVFVISAGAGLVLGNQLTIGGMVASVVMLNRVFLPFLAFLKTIPGLRQCRENWSVIGATFAQRHRADHRIAVAPVKGAPVLELRDVHLRAGLTQEPLLEQLNMKIGRGKIVQIEGPAGCGKSVMGETMVWAARPFSGMVLIGGVRASVLSADELAKTIGYVAEIPVFVKGSLADNISGFDQAEDRAEIQRAAQFAQIHRQILELPQGYQTQIDELGLPLAKSMRELLALARAVYRQPDLLVIDQPSTYLSDVFLPQCTETLKAYVASGGSLVLLERRASTLPFKSDLYRLAQRRCRLVHGNKQTQDAVLLMAGGG